MLIKNDVLQKLSAIKEDAAVLGFEKIGVFGSLSQDRHTSMSDIDIAVISNKDLTGGGFEYLDKLEILKEKLYKLFKRPVDIYDLGRNKETEIGKKIAGEVVYV